MAVQLRSEVAELQDKVQSLQQREVEAEAGLEDERLMWQARDEESAERYRAEVEDLGKGGRYDISRIFSSASLSKKRRDDGPFPPPLLPSDAISPSH